MSSTMPNMAMVPPTRFTGEESARRWIIGLRFTSVHDLPVKEWIELVDASLYGGPADWADSHPDVKIIRSLENPLEADKQHFIKLLQERYPGKSSAETTQAEAEASLDVLKQGAAESLKEYYERTRGLLLELHTKDRTPGADLTFIEGIMLSQAVVKFVNGIQDSRLRAEVSDRYLDVTDSANRSLRAAHDMAEQQTRIMAAKDLRMKLEEEKAQQGKYETIAKALNEVVSGGSNKAKAWKSLQTSMDMSAESLNAALASYIRPARNQPPRIPSHERVQDVTHEAPPSNPIPIQRYTGYSSQDSRGQQQALNTIASASAPTQPYWNNDRRMREDQEFAQHAHSHPNPFINGSMIYNRDLHGYCCYKCGKLGHVLGECEAPPEEWLSRPAKRALQGICQPGTAASRNRNDQYEVVQPGTMTRPNQALQQPVQPSANTPFNPAVKVANYRDEAPLMGRQGPSTQSPNPNVMPETQPYTYVYDPNRKSRESREPRVFAVQASSENLEEPSSNSVTMSSGALHDDNILRVFDTKPKRRRLYNVNEPSSSDEKEQLPKEPAKASTRPKKEGAKRKGRKKTMKPILGMINKPEVNVEDILIHSNITLPALYLYQISPYFRDETRRLIQAPRKPRKKKEAAQEPVKEAEKEPAKETTRQESTATPMEVDYAAVDTEGEETHWAVREYHDTIANEKAAFGVPAILSKDGKEPHVGLPPVCSKADQGSDLVLINDGLAKELKLRYRSTKDFSPRGVTMTVADGNHTKLNHWVTFTINVEGIKRIVWAFVNPRNTSTKLLLGMPWLKAVNAVIDIPNKTITIGDTKKREATKIINSYIMDSEAPNCDRKGKKLTKKELTRLGKTIKRVAMREAGDDPESEYSGDDESSEASSAYNSSSEDEYEDFQ